MVMITDQAIIDAGLTYNPPSRIGMHIMNSLFKLADDDWQGTFPIKAEWTEMRDQTLEDMRRAFSSAKAVDYA